MIKLIVTDMDDTLLNKDKKIPEKTRDILIKYEQNGTKLCLASGRPPLRLMEYAKSLQMDTYNGYLITSNGGSTYSLETNTSTTIRLVHIEESIEIYNYLHPLFENVELIFLAEVDAYIKCAKGHTTSMHFKTEIPERVAHRNFHYIEDISELHEEICKICVCGDPKDILKVKEALYKFKPDKYWFGIVHNFWLEITPIEISKGRALQKIMDDNHYKKEEVLIFGDGENDISMMQCGISVGMSNSIDSLKKMCQYITTKSNNEEGIYTFLKEEPWNF